MNHFETPLLNQLLVHKQKNPISFHVPGHKFGEIFPIQGHTYFKDILRLDATEITGLDDLHAPEGAILEAEKLLAGLYKVKKSFFLINGSTSGNLAMIMGTVKEEDKVLVQRNSHKSIMNGIRLAKARPVFLGPEYNPDWAVTGGVSIETIRKAIQMHPDAKAVILTHPNYYGMVYDLKKIIDLAHQNGIPVLVDEAHGVHFIAGEPFPASAVSLGADVVVQSAHKTLPAMTMGAFLHYNSSLIPMQQINYYLQVLQSSSPSYPIMASLDAARSYLGTFKVDDKSYLLDEIEAFKHNLKDLDGIRLLSSDRTDPLKMTMQSTNGLSGFALQKLFEAEGVYTELADPANVLFVLPLLKKGMDYRFVQASKKIAHAVKQIPPGRKKREKLYVKNEEISTLEINYKSMDRLPTETVLLKESAGRISAEMIIPYPPGIPLCFPGEMITTEKLEMLNYLKNAGARFQGAQHLDAGKVSVFIF
ncbi:aminotransferase class I/II-fold pyridoxal phosphate-dependent enzyme [Bacillus sp. T33-2]|uniref:aminotransferase class I/II-fold pyridoxal phosphate-dependent enzyme n=1 Tax=Bacillus sp. T33-2 TaxID=2054168 RepID=UPI000C77936F|nr:aminotransferase class I/II-fold pyridoxal phosphate-dependent enzyme [Bacillus sp. T33-2]PLR93326.1 arginine decarboxylase [Bacillus sp. T33-2]